MWLLAVLATLCVCWREAKMRQHY